MPKGIRSGVEDVTCLCGQVFTAPKSEKRKFCSKTCPEWIRVVTERVRKITPSPSNNSWGYNNPEKLKIWRERQSLSHRGEQGPRKDLTGSKYGRLLVTALKGRSNRSGEYIWFCRCDCDGKIIEVERTNLVSGNTESCGCLKKEWNLLPKSTKTKAKMSRSQKDLPPEKREKQRQSMLVSILSGKYSPHENRYQSSHKIETLKGGTICCQSSWEILLAKFLDRNSGVSRFEKDKIRLPYFYNKEHIFIVDFLVTYCDGKQELVEVKPEAFLTIEENPAKIEAATKWCEERNINFVLITEHEIKLIRGDN